MPITTNGHVRPLYSLADLEREGKITDDQATDEFGYLAGPAEADDDEGHGWFDYYSERLVRAYGQWWDVADAQLIARADDPSAPPFSMRVQAGDPIIGWHGIITHSHGTGTVFRSVTDPDTLDICGIVVGWWTA